MTIVNFDPGQIAYEAYRLASDGVSLVSGAALPEWDDQEPAIRQAWSAAEDGVITGLGLPRAGDLADDAYRLTAAGQPRADAEAPRYALVEQMGHRSTVAAVRETTFCGKPMLEMTELSRGGVHLVSPDSLYEVTWLTEDEARNRAKPWTAVAISAASPDPWGDDEDVEDAGDQDPAGVSLP